MDFRLFATVFVTILALPGSVGADEADVAAVRESKVELFVHDPAASIAFYARLGFDVRHAKPDGYTTLGNGPAVIALSPLPGWLPLHWLGFLRYPPLGTEIVLYTTRLEALRSAVSSGGHSPSEVVRQPWGDRDFRVTDPDGYYVRITEGSAIPESATAAPK